MKPAILFAIILLGSISCAQVGAGLGEGLNRFCAGVKDMLPSAAMLMVVLGSVIYAAGQMMGAETRARANVWATAALTGAIVAILIATITPVFLKQIYGGDFFCIGPAIQCPAGNHICQCSHIVNGGIGNQFCVPRDRATCSANDHRCHYV